MADTLIRATLFVNESGDIFNGPAGSDQYDARLFHPRTAYLNGRPEWLLMDNKRSIYRIDPESITINYPVIVKAFSDDEDENAVPLDVIEIREFSDQKAWFYPGDSIH